MTDWTQSPSSVDLDDIAAYDYELPQHLIAQHPIEPRDSSRLFVLNRATGAFTHVRFSDIGDFLHTGDLLVANESRVLPARLHGHKAETGASVELLLLAPRPDYGATAWETLVKPGRRIRKGQRIEIADGLTVEVLENTSAGGRIVRFWVNGTEDSTLLLQRLEQLGEMPLPPYIRAPLLDPERYQTVYAHTPGSAAAPTAGLHFTPSLIATLAARGIDMVYVTLHVGLDTFRPVEETHLHEHHMHGESFAISAATAETINATRAAGGHIVAVGTTTVRTLESAATHGLPLQPIADRTELFITPGFNFHLCDALITNFHLPRSTLLALVSAFAGYERMVQAYTTAIAQGYRFYSFGDAMLIL